MSADPKAPEPPTDAELTRMHGVSPAEVAAEYAEARKAVNAEPPATPEPAAPRIHTGRLAGIITQATGPHWCGSAEMGDLALDLRDARAKVAELEARIAAFTPFDKVGAERLADEVAVLIERKVVDARDPAGDALLDYREPPSTPRADRMAVLEAALARANEALRSLLDASDFLSRTDFAERRHDLTDAEAEAWIGLNRAQRQADSALGNAVNRAQGSAAQKPEGPA